MTDYTPTTEDVRAAWIEAHKVDTWGRAMDRDARPRTRVAEFDRWLAAHDAEVRAAALAEYEPEPDESLDDCAACDMPLATCGGRDAACCDDCTHSANWAPVRENGSK